MGVYLSEPNKQKISIEGSNASLRFVASEMQGIKEKNKNINYFI